MFLNVFFLSKFEFKNVVNKRSVCVENSLNGELMKALHEERLMEFVRYSTVTY